MPNAGWAGISAWRGGASNKGSGFQVPGSGFSGIGLWNPEPGTWSPEPLTAAGPLAAKFDSIVKNPEILAA